MISRSPDRMSFQKEKYIERCKENGEEPNPAYLEMYDNGLKQYDARFDDPESIKNNLEYDLLTCPWMLEKVRKFDYYAQNLYAALCNMQWCKRDLVPALRQSDEDLWGCSWRYAGGIIADMQQQGDYIDWYCSGMGGLNQEYDSKETNEQWQKRTGYVQEGFITDEVETDLNKLGWFPVPYKDE